MLSLTAHHCIDQNAAIVPHVAMISPLARTKPSHQLQCPASAIFADTGPMTQSRNDENAPKNAIIELNPGTKIDTATEHIVKSVRSTRV